MFNDEGLGEAMARSHADDRIKQLEDRVAALERSLRTVTDVLRQALRG